MIAWLLAPLAWASDPVVPPDEPLAEVTVPAPIPEVPPVKPKVPPGISGKPGYGVTVTTADGKLSTTIRARIQIRDTLSVDGETVGNEATIKTVRLFWTGHIFNERNAWTLQLAVGPKDFGPESPSPIFDAYLDFTHLRDLNVRVGQFFVPFDRARTIREFALQMVDRQAVVQEFTLDRDTGVLIYSNDLGGLGGRLGYKVGLFGGKGRNRIGGTPVGGMATARLEVRPGGTFEDETEGDLERDPTPRVLIGLGAALNLNTDKGRSTTGDTLAGPADYLHGAADLHLKVAGFSLLAEGVVRKALEDEIEGVDAAGNAVTGLARSGWGAFGQAGMMATQNLEFTGRYGHQGAFQGSDEAWTTSLGESAHEVAAGANWYVNGHRFKIQTDWNHRFERSFAEGHHEVRLALDAMF